MKSKFIVGTRGSKLALWQAEFVRARLLEIRPEARIELEIIKTFGDRQQNLSLAEIGGRGVFTKDLETALLAGQIDLAVHSLKDLPTVLPESLHIAAVLEREDARDALILPENAEIEFASIERLPPDAVVGTSSLRRASQLKHRRPDLQIKDLRGNVDTRLRKLDAGEYDAIVLAVAGLKRLGWANRISRVLSLDEMLPQVGQGALALETRRGDAATNDFVAALNHAETFACISAERAFLRGLGGGCQFPIAAHAAIERGELTLRGLVAAPDGGQVLRGKIRGKTPQGVQRGEILAKTLLIDGAADLINLKF